MSRAVNPFVVATHAASSQRIAYFNGSRKCARCGHRFFRARYKGKASANTSANGPWRSCELQNTFADTRAELVTRARARATRLRGAPLSARDTKRIMTEHAVRPPSPAILLIRELPPSERPRERLVSLGAGALSSAELLAVLLGSGTASGSALQVGHALLASAGGSLRRIAMQPVASLTTTAGVGPARAVTVHAALELGRRLAAEVREDGAPVRSPRDVARLFAPRLEDLPVEEFHVAVLDAQHRLERDVLITRGILTSSLVHPREVFREAIAERAAAVILVHNHPSGDPTPSADDRVVTEQLVAAGKLLDIPVHDHIIIGRGRYTSFAEAGLL